MIRATVSAWPFMYMFNPSINISSSSSSQSWSPKLITIITIITKTHQGNCVCLAIYTPNPRQPSNNSTASHQASLVRILKFVPVTTITFNCTIAWESWGHVICFLPIMLSIEYRLIYALWPCTQICFPELQSFQKKKCFLLKREHSSIDFSYRFLNDGDDNIWQLSVGANIDA